MVTLSNNMLFKLKMLRIKFCAIGKPLSYFYYLGYILEGLGNEYYPFVITIQNCTDGPSITDVPILLWAYEARLEKQTLVNQLNLIQANVANLSISQNSCRPKWPPYDKSFTPTTLPMLGFVPFFIVVLSGPDILDNARPLIPLSNFQTIVLNNLINLQTVVLNVRFVVSLGT